MTYNEHQASILQINLKDQVVKLIKIKEKRVSSFFQSEKYIKRSPDDTPTIYKYNDKCCLVFGIRKLIYQEVRAKTAEG